MYPSNKIYIEIYKNVFILDIIIKFYRLSYNLTSIKIGSGTKTIP